MQLNTTIRINQVWLRTTKTQRSFGCYRKYVNLLVIVYFEINLRNQIFIVEFIKVFFLESKTIKISFNSLLKV